MLSDVKKLALCSALLSLTACGAAERLANVGQAPEFTPIENVKAPRVERSLSLPMPAMAESRNESKASLWRTGAKAFFKDQRASRIGDILTVEIDISDQAQIGNSTNRTRATEEDAGLPNLFGVEEALRSLIASPSAAAGSTSANVRGAFDPSSLVSANADSTYTGTGTVNRSETIQMTVAAIVTDVLPNGNLVIQARQEVRVNFEKRELLLAGIIRPEDISSSNVIQHTQIAEARISYGGQGQITDVQQPRYGTQVYDIIFPF